MKKPAKNRLDFGIRLGGDLVEAFERERRKEGAAKSELARTLIVEALRARGHEVEDTMEWGGYRPRREDGEDEGQPVAVA